jgi:hypothetical protein
LVVDMDRQVALGVVAVQPGVALKGIGRRQLGVALALRLAVGEVVTLGTAAAESLHA